MHSSWLRPENPQALRPAQQLGHRLGARVHQVLEPVEDQQESAPCEVSLSSPPTPVTVRSREEPRSRVSPDSSADPARERVELQRQVAVHRSAAGLRLHVEHGAY
ncbi:hypothetical protein ADK57_07735 [Streptomyces sp. MMG1533]|nr:hypothetical protein ADK57_07735 [Streptomyces sp. MMG1533]